MKRASVTHWRLWKGLSDAGGEDVPGKRREAVVLTKVKLPSVTLSIAATAAAVDRLSVVVLQRILNVAEA
jgi:hypothetical protein